MTIKELHSNNCLVNPDEVDDSNTKGANLTSTKTREFPDFDWEKCLSFDRANVNVADKKGKGVHCNCCDVVWRASGVPRVARVVTRHPCRGVSRLRGSVLRRGLRSSRGLVIRKTFNRFDFVDPSSNHELEVDCRPVPMSICLKVTMPKEFPF